MKSAALAFDFINGGLDVRDRSEVLGTPGACLDSHELAERKDLERTTLEINRYARVEQILVTPAFINRAQAIEVAKTGFHKDVSRPDEVCGIGLQAAWIVPGNRLQVP